MAAPPQTTPAAAPESVLRFEKVSVAFAGEYALREVSFDVRRGDTCIVFGAAGSGKTVMLKTALGLVKPDSGRVFLFNQDITDLPEEDLFDIRSKVGILFQESALFDSLTIEENVSYPLLNRRGKERKKDFDPKPKVEESLRFVGLEDTLSKFPSELSGGMRRRVGIARAAVTDPPLILYDSPTAGLDPITANTIVALIVKNRDLHNTTSVLVTHRYQDGHIMANFSYDPENGHNGDKPTPGTITGLRQDSKDGQGPDVHTRFMVFREGKLVFEGPESELGRSQDEYVARFVRRENNTYGKR